MTPPPRAIRQTSAGGLLRVHRSTPACRVPHERMAPKQIAAASCRAFPGGTQESALACCIAIRRPANGRDLWPPPSPKYNNAGLLPHPFHAGTRQDEKTDSATAWRLAAAMDMGFQD